MRPIRLEPFFFLKKKRLCVRTVPPLFSKSFPSCTPLFLSISLHLRSWTLSRGRILAWFALIWEIFRNIDALNVVLAITSLSHLGVCIFLSQVLSEVFQFVLCFSHWKSCWCFVIFYVVVSILSLWAFCCICILHFIVRLTFVVSYFYITLWFSQYIITPFAAVFLTVFFPTHH